ncbi:MAG: hypothetical protein HY859_15770 [Caulobacterales bacterium]|nr:hypothetical protein [Caulobacterales bacterium]
MLRLNGIVLSIATLLVAGPTLAAPTGSIADPFETMAPEAAFSRYPDLVRFRTIGSPDGRTFASLSDETAAAITRVETMMRDVDTGWSEVIELRILTASEADRTETAALIAADPRLSVLPVSYRVVDRLPADRARVGLDVLVSSASAARLVGH